MEFRVLRPISKAVVAASTAGAIATACWLLNRILDDHEPECMDVTTSYLKIKATPTSDDYNATTNYKQQQECDTDDSFALLPVVSESDDECDENAMGCYTADYFTPHYDVCILSVSVQTLVDPLPDLLSNESNECRLGRTAIKSCDSIDDSIQLDEKNRALSFSITETSSKDSVLSISSKWEEEEGIEWPMTSSTTQQTLYVRL